MKISGERACQAEGAASAKALRLLFSWCAQSGWRPVIDLPAGTSGKETHLPMHVDERDTGLIPGSGRSPGEGHGNPLQYCCLENPMDRKIGRATVRAVEKSWTRLK